MTVWVLDALLYVLLLAAIGFGGISVVGLLLFPDIRSRAFTGLRAGILATALVTAAGVCYGFFAYMTVGGLQVPAVYPCGDPDACPSGYPEPGCHRGCVPLGSTDPVIGCRYAGRPVICRFLRACRHPVASGRAGNPATGFYRGFDQDNPRFS